MSLPTVLLLTFAAICAAGGQLFFKVGAQNAQAIKDYFNLWLFFGLIFYGLGTAVWIYALSFEKLVNVYAFTALTFVLVYLGGIFIIRESITTTGFIGILLVVGGLYLITSQSHPH